VKELIKKLSRNQEIHFKNFTEFWIFYFWKDIEDNPLSLSGENRLPGCLSLLELAKMGATKSVLCLGFRLVASIIHSYLFY
jgi:hypothetical protein